jgi:hypothetical protein
LTLSGFDALGSQESVLISFVFAAALALSSVSAQLSGAELSETPAVQDGTVAEETGPFSFVLDDAFHGDGLTIPTASRMGGYGAFDVAAADMDLDGDVDVFINWHLGGLELCENTGAGFQVLNVPEADVSGLGEQPGVPSLYARRGATLDALGELPPGIHVWHENALVWSLCLVPPPEGPATALVLRSNESFAEVEGLRQGESLHADRQGLRLTLVPGGPARLLHLANGFPSADLRLRQDESAAVLWPYHVGRTPTRFDTARVQLRKPDPHGIAWVQAFGSAEPELIITRGGNRGTLSEPDPPKSNRVFVYRGDGVVYEQLDPLLAPRDHSRGRSVEWVDVNNDGSNELSIGNKTSPNALWFLDEPAESSASGPVFVDRAAQVGLDHQLGDASAWFDVNGDGLQDQLVLHRHILRFWLNRGDAGFEMSPGLSYGLDLGGSFEERSTGFDKTSLSVFDIDGDGALDVWLSSLGAQGFHKVFRREGAGFLDVTEALGLSELTGTGSTTRLDVDDDGFIDVLALGRQALLLWNRGGELFDVVPLSEVAPGVSGDGSREGLISAATAADIDGDQRTDLVLVGQSRQIAYNRTANQNRSLIVHLADGGFEPVGALVRVHTDDGRASVQRYGSASKSFVSQTLPPLHFGVAAETVITALEVLWPGDTVWTACELPTTAVLQLTRR